MKKFFASVIAVFATVFSLPLSAIECTGFSLDWSNLTQYSTNKFDLTDEDYDPSLDMRFRRDEETGAISTGIYDLGSKINSSYATCEECILLSSDLVDNYYTKFYFQKSGSLTIEAVDAKNNIQGTISAVLAEVTINNESLETTFIENGECVEIDSASFNTFCTPNCAGKICGDDGCGGSCGDGCGDLACSADQKSCVEYSCEKITLKNPTFDKESFDYFGSYLYNFNYTPALHEDDRTLLEFWDAELVKVGEYDLAGTNYANCLICVQLFEYNSDTINKRFFQQSGKLNITAFDADSGNINATFSDLRLVEIVVDVDSDTLSKEVPGGKCYEIEDISFTYPTSGTGEREDDSQKKKSDGCSLVII